MSYYDFEHFWSSQELCQQQQGIDRQGSLFDRIICLLNQVYSEIFPARASSSEQQNQD
jgi:hypothetical protein